MLPWPTAGGGSSDSTGGPHAVPLRRFSCAPRLGRPRSGPAACAGNPHLAPVGGEHRRPRPRRAHLRAGSPGPRARPEIPHLSEFVARHKAARHARRLAERQGRDGHLSPRLRRAPGAGILARRIAGPGAHIRGGAGAQELRYFRHAAIDRRGAWHPASRVALEPGRISLQVARDQRPQVGREYQATGVRPAVRADDEERRRFRGDHVVERDLCRAANGLARCPRHNLRRYYR